MSMDAIRCFHGNAKPGDPYWQVRNAAGDAPELAFDGPISEYIYLDEFTRVRMADLFKQDLYAVGKGGPVTVRVNSPGGDIWAASAIRAVMLDYPGEITTRVDSVCASAATFLLTAGKRTLMVDTSSLMVHDPAVLLFLASVDIAFGKMIVSALESFKDGCLTAYEQRTGLSREKLSKMMSNTTYMSARESVEFGFADEVITGQQAAPRLQNSFINNLETYYGTVPSYVLSLAEPEPPAPIVDDARELEAQRLRAYIRIHKS